MFFDVYACNGQLASGCSGYWLYMAAICVMGAGLRLCRKPRMPRGVRDWEGMLTFSMLGTTSFDMVHKLKGVLAAQVATKIAELARQRSMHVGDPLREVVLASELGLSRTPVRRGLTLLTQYGIAVKSDRTVRLAIEGEQIDLSTLPFGDDPLEDLYLRIAADCASGVIAEEFSEAELIRKLNVSRGKLLKVLGRLANDGMVNRKAGHGWRISPFLRDVNAHIESYRFRMSIEPAAIMEPDFRIDTSAFKEIRSVQMAMLEREAIPAEEVFENGCRFHEMLVRCSGNRFFIEAVERQNQLRRFIEYHAAPEHCVLTKQCKEHLEILDLIESGSREHASAFMRRHLDVASKDKDGQPVEGIGPQF
ncbi:GntR family transcriptional regulator [Paraburkholderia sp. Tr-20389]|uniref:GntR family transcriptional regulator n=1 Tax=Paraburkholderia sp. Tr-20389 TaxID=2703903 RepID=UPI00197DBAB4|nr:GntR family transcriptional regulator [Paraburkholderia sp. Tr-20389]MBN3754761.1 GntR family transcriptional regulator [Paraburkholderia sp. Tr-20389]